MYWWPEISDNILQRVLWQFTSQRYGYLLPEIRSKKFRKNHPQALIFHETLDYVITNITMEYLYPNDKKVEWESTNYWDLHDDFLVQNTKYWINEMLKLRLGVLTNDIDIDFITALSAEKQENRSVKDAAIVIIPFERFNSLCSDDVIVSFEKSNQKKLQVPNSHAVRKQLELTQEGCLAVSKVPGEDTYQTVGIISRESANNYPQFRLTRFMEWEFLLPNPCKKLTCRLRYCQGTIMMPLLDLENALGAYVKSNLSDVLKDSDLTVVSKLTEGTKACTHGAILILSEKDEISKEAQRLTSNNRGILLKNTIPLMHTSQKADEKSISRFSSIDGAILADFDGNCYAFGVILDGTVVTQGNPDRGSRYNSTKTFVDSKLANEQGEKIPNAIPYIGIVRSEDGMVDILWGQELHCCAKEQEVG